MSLLRDILYALTTEWKTIRIDSGPKVSYIYNHHAPGKVCGITYQEDDWNGIRFDDNKGKRVANFHQSITDEGKTLNLRGLNNCRWCGELVPKPGSEDGEVIIKNIKIRKIVSIF